MQRRIDVSGRPEIAKLKVKRVARSFELRIFSSMKRGAECCGSEPYRLELLQREKTQKFDVAYKRIKAALDTQYLLTEITTNEI